MTVCHTPVLARQTLELLAPPVDRAAHLIDATAGEGGHSEAFLDAYPLLRVTCIDADAAILAVARERLARFGDRVEFWRGWSEDYFVALPPQMSAPAAPQMPAPPAVPVSILIDLGVSLFHYEQGDRGFSFRKDEPLDMRIDTGRGEPAAELIARLREEELAALLWRNAEERGSRKIAAAIAHARRQGALESSAALAALVEAAVGRRVSGGRQAARGGQGVRRQAAHPATKTFQALRIAVNGELERLEARLCAAFAALATGGRLGVISFHSLEDRIVKNVFREWARPCVCPPDVPICRCRGTPLCRVVTAKPVTADEQEARQNPPSRSAKLRVVEKVKE